MSHHLSLLRYVWAAGRRPGLRVARAAVLALAVCVTSAGAADERPGAADGDLRAAVSRAIDRGVEALLATQRADGGWATYDGYPAAVSALAYHTLRTSGVPATDPSLVRAYEALRREYVAARDRRAMRVYTASLVMLAVADHALAAAPDRAPAAAAHGRGGRIVPAGDLSWMNELVAYLAGVQCTSGAWRYGETTRYGSRGSGTDDHDHSNTQYAAMGLRAASSIGSRVDPDLWIRLSDHLVAAQEADGPKIRAAAPSDPRATHDARADRARGWSYYRLDNARFTQPSPDAYGSMTAGCVAALAAARRARADAGTLPARTERELTRSIRDGVAWLGLHFDVTRNPGRAGWHTYYLYSLERAGDIAEVRRMGAHDWYDEGARHLVAAQLDDGRWQDAVPEPVATCFALLFLRRASLVAVTPGSRDEPLRFEAAARIGGRDLADFLGLVTSRWRRTDAPAERAAIARGTASLGERVVPFLLAALDDEAAAVRRANHELLAAVTGLALPYDAYAESGVRGPQLEEISRWFDGVCGKLTFDAESGRLRSAP